ncbi:hypothetical protein [Pseudomonas fluorescens]|uniref:Peptidase C39 domain-containing protein n=1 Tax=Pseudomonas fluorescens TaxID=294 RepID=A0A0F4VFG1_PSEFL|nr:hypothetical protein [Pseudomonas fluorescens]KJZ67270.1 hypothetical protein VD17_03155 [Pseudomonas fluorescens]
MITQKTKTDCGIASFANALSLTYEQAAACFCQQAPQTGTTAADTCNALLNIGLTPVYATFQAFYDHLGTPGNPASPEVVRNHPAILTVLSSNRRTLHAVYWNGQEAYDPDPHACNPRKLADLTILEAVFAHKPGLCANGFSGSEGGI